MLSPLTALITLDCHALSPHAITVHQDEVVVVEKYGPSGEWGFFSVYDGHGGRMAVEHVKVKSQARPHPLALPSPAPCPS